MRVAPAGLDENACLVLVDYDNAFPPNAKMQPEEIAVQVERWLRQIASAYRDLRTFEVRMYGGWYDDQNLSRHGSEVAKIIALMPKFPIRLSNGQLVRGTIGLATNLLTARDAVPLLGTYRQRGSLPRVRLSAHPYPSGCARIDATCPAAILRSFTKSTRRECPVDSCGLVSSDAFVLHEQKMVDTLLATDILAAGRLNPGYSLVVVVSGDSDFVPPLLNAREFNTVRFIQLLPRPEEASEYSTRLLAEAGVDVIEGAA